MSAKIAAIVITYFPTEEMLHNINSYLPFVDKLFIADNSEPNFIFPTEILNNPKIEIIHDGENKGIAIRLNQAAETLIQQGFPWMLTMDQDSYFDEKIIETYTEYFKNRNDTDGVAMFGVDHDSNTNIVNTDLKYVNVVITSGSMVNLKLLSTIGFFDERLFIYHVDNEFCYRALDKGFKIVYFPNIFMHHKMGSVKLYRSLLNFKKTYRALYTPVSIYYAVRNFLYMNDLYKSRFKTEMNAERNFIFNRVKNSFIYQKNKMQMIKMYLKAYRDYKTNKMGKIQS